VGWGTIDRSVRASPVVSRSSAPIGECAHCATLTECARRFASGNNASSGARRPLPARTGWDAIRIIARDARRHLEPRGWLLLEHGFDQGATVSSFLEALGYRDIANFGDLANQPRVAQAHT
jgi:hypothetical protein